MPEERKRLSILSRLWWLLDASRRALLNLIFLALIGLVLWAWLRPAANMNIALPHVGEYRTNE